AARLLAAWESRFPASFTWKRLAGEPLIRDERRARQMLRELVSVEHRRAEGLPNDAYHAGRIADAARQFDDVETTVSHAYAAPHPALGGRSYGEAFFDVCLERGLISERPRVLEIGGGTGRFARAFLDRFAARRPDAYRSSSYALFDLS